VLAITAFVQCLVHALSDEIDRGTYQHDCHPMMVRLNKWRACRHGLGAVLVDPYTQEAMPASQLLRRLRQQLDATSKELSCEPYLDLLDDLAATPTGADRQRGLARDCGGDLVEVVRRLVTKGAR
jgi:carboxylate-amine ligase